MTKVCVIGSIAMDLVTKTNRIPNEGETIFGESFAITPGGKGANQAVAFARLCPNEVSMIGAVGNDPFGNSILNNFKENNVVFDGVKITSQTTGVAQITLFNNDNRIIIIPGANNMVFPDHLDNFWKKVKNSQLVILQNEIPHETNLVIAKYCKEHGIKVLYNPAPARKTDREMIEYVDYFTPNEHECNELFPDENIEEILSEHSNRLIITLGSKGVMFHDGQMIQKIPAIKSQVVDTTGAGDTFNGAFAFGLIKNLSIRDSIRLAVVAAHLSVQKFGAQGGMPDLLEVESKLKELQINIL